MASPTPPSITHIALIYRIYFLYWEPIGACIGAFLNITNPARTLRATLPLPVTLTLTTPSDPIIHVSPLLRMHLIMIASLYILFAIMIGIVLRLTRQKSIWLAVLSAMVCTDIGHLYGIWELAPGRFFEVASWNFDEWTNYGTLFAGMGLRIAFLMGFGRR
ncbi:hypothetical protein VTL71DRAFT_4986 [Oculimacula yallundae]|uniref:DUF7704 domain-containing protein n=1 Tax=Oculimacula yallundae TaxID=86028 RepID=A0ABR4C3H3_9HELO